jgi:arylsulfatase A-like enzyme
MERKIMLRRTFLGAAGALAAQSPTPPNILLVLADDLGIGSVGCYSPESQIRTPHLDSLAKRGMRFTDAHSPSSLCTPTRYGLITGRYCWRTRLKQGVLNGESPNLIEDGRPTIATLLKTRGYQTGVFGKWHLGLGTAAKADYSRPLHPSPLDHGFDEFFGIPASLDMPPYIYIDGRMAVEQPTATIADHGEIKRGPYWRGGSIAPGFKMDEVVPKITQRAESFIRKHGAAKQPFFAYVPLPTPHTPWVPTAKSLGRSKANLYGDFVEEFDDHVGTLLRAIEETGQTRNTLVIVTSDNGSPWEKRDMEENRGHWANGRLRGQKSDAYEGGHRIPFLLRWPGRAPAATTATAQVCLTDCFATIAQAAGASIPANSGEDSYAIQPALQRPNDTSAVRNHVVHHAGNGMFAVRQGHWKLIDGLGSGGFTLPQKLTAVPGGPTGQLYDLRQDPFEYDNVYSKHPNVVAQLTAVLNQVRAGERP